MRDYWDSDRIREIGFALVPEGEIVVFSDDAQRVHVDFEWWAKGWKDDVQFWATCITCGLSKAMTSEATLITDEQHNTESLVEEVEETHINDLVYIVVGTYGATFMPRIIAGPRNIAIGFGDNITTVIATLQAKELIAQKTLYEQRVPEEKEIEQVLSKYIVL